LPRLSEVLDFDYEGEFDAPVLKTALENYFFSSLKLPKAQAVIKGQGSKVYFKFPILKALGLTYGKSQVLYLKIEPTPCPVAPKTVEVSQVNRDGLYFFIRRYALPDLMSGKIHVFLTRAFYKGKENEIDFKGRDLFDLVWYMGKNIRPDLARLKVLMDDTPYRGLAWAKLLEKIGAKIKKIKKQHLVADIQQFIENDSVLEQFLSNYLQVFSQYERSQK